ARWQTSSGWGGCPHRPWGVQRAGPGLAPPGWRGGSPVGPRSPPVWGGAGAAAVAVAAAGAVLSGGEHVHPASFDVSAGRVMRGSWRSAWTYGLRWRASMMFAGLGGRFDGAEWIPRVVRVRAGRYVDRITVRMV